MNLKADALGKRFEKFINDYGFDKNNRLLFFYSGHGHTRTDEWDNEKGYLVPTDAPNPHFDEKCFLQKALEMNQILTWARRIEAKHALFLFDSCFSGTVFKAKALPKVPRQISKAAKLPVRQFITCGRCEAGNRYFGHLGTSTSSVTALTRCFIRLFQGFVVLWLVGLSTTSEYSGFTD